MSDLEDRVAAIQQRMERARAGQAQAEVQHQAAQDRLKAAREALAAEFPGITTGEEARKQLDALEAAASTEVSKVEAALAAAGG